MPAVLKIDPQRRIVLTTFHGHVTGEDLVRQQAVILADPRFETSFADVVDFSSVSVAAIDESALTSLAGTSSIFGPNVPHVIVAPADLQYELAVKYRVLTQKSRPNLHVVRTLAEAQQLLDGLGYRL